MSTQIDFGKIKLIDSGTDFTIKTDGTSNWVMTYAGKLTKTNVGTIQADKIVSNQPSGSEIVGRATLNGSGIVVVNTSAFVPSKSYVMLTPNGASLPAGFMFATDGTSGTFTITSTKGSTDAGYKVDWFVMNTV